MIYAFFAIAVIVVAKAIPHVIDLCVMLSAADRLMKEGLEHRR